MPAQLSSSVPLSRALHRVVVLQHFVMRQVQVVNFRCPIYLLVAYNM
jgi:hypothetical protein